MNPLASRLHQVACLASVRSNIRALEHSNIRVFECSNVCSLVSVTVVVAVVALTGQQFEAADDDDDQRN